MGPATTSILIGVVLLTSVFLASASNSVAGPLVHQPVAWTPAGIAKETSAFATATESVAIAPVSGPVNTQITLTASGLTPITSYGVFFDPVQATGATHAAACTTDSSGALTGAGGDAVCQFAVPSVGVAMYYVDLFESVSGNYTASASSPFTVTTPSLTTSPTSGPVNTQVTLTASGFAPTTVYDLYFDTSQGTGSSFVTAFTTLGNGSCSGIFNVPSIVGGTYWVDAFEDLSGNYVASASSEFTMTPSSVTANPIAGPVNTQVTLTASGLAAATVYDLYFDTSQGTGFTFGTTFTTLGNGTYGGVFDVPSIGAGTYWVDAFEDVSGNYVASTSSEFTVTASNVTVSPVSGPVSTEVAVTATGQAPATEYQIYFDTTAGAQLNYATSCTADAGGALTGSGGDAPCQFPAPSITVGTYYVDLFESVSGNYIASASSEFTVTTPSVTVSPTSGPVNTQATLTVSGFAPTTVYDLYFDTSQGTGSIFATMFTSLENGSYGGVFTVPSLLAGTFWVDAFEDVSGNYISSASSEVTVTTPSVTVSPISGPVNTPVTLTASDLAPTTVYDLYFDTSQGTGFTFGTTFTTLGNGSYSGTFNVPSIAAGTYWLDIFEDVSGNYIASAPSEYTVTASTYAVTFSETGMPTAAGGGVSFDGGVTEAFTSGGTLTFPGLANGNYPYVIMAGTGYQLVSSSPSSPVTVSGANVGVSVTFEELFSVTFTETNLPTGTPWSVTLDSAAASGSAPSSITFIEPNGTYAYTIEAIPGWTTSSHSGSVTVTGAAVNVSVVWTQVSYTITFTETSLPSGTSWSATLNAVTKDSTGSTITFTEPNGTYAYSLGAVPGWTTSGYTGSVVVNGTAVGIAVPWAEFTYSVTFTEIGLPSATSWSVTLAGSSRSSTTDSIVFTEPNGTYTYAANPVGAYYVQSGGNGTFTVHGATQSFSVTYATTTSSSSFPWIWVIIGVVIAGVVAGIAIGLIRHRRPPADRGASPPPTRAA